MKNGLRWCRLCKDWLPASSFGSNKAQPEGYSLECKPCKREMQKEFQRKYREREEDIYGI